LDDVKIEVSRTLMLFFLPYYILKKTKSRSKEINDESKMIIEKKNEGGKIKWM